MIAAGYDALSARRGDPARRRHRRAGFDGQPIRHRDRFRRSPMFRSAMACGFDRRPASSVSVLGIFFVMRYAERVKKDPSKSLIFAQKEENESPFLHRSGGRR